MALYKCIFIYLFIYLFITLKQYSLRNTVHSFAFSGWHIDNMHNFCKCLFCTWNLVCKEEKNFKRVTIQACFKCSVPEFICPFLQTSNFNASTLCRHSPMGHHGHYSLVYMYMQTFTICFSVKHCC